MVEVEQNKAEFKVIDNDRRVGPYAPDRSNLIDEVFNIRISATLWSCEQKTGLSILLCK